MSENVLTVTMLGTGTSQGIPVIGCSCSVCTSPFPEDKRLRTSIYVTHKSTKILIDIGPDFRQQALTNGLSGVDAILMTHEHSDHTAGIDDIRPFNFLQRKEIPIFSLKRVQEDIHRRFAYIFSDCPYPGAPKLSSQVIEPFQKFNIGSIDIIPLDILHGELPILGFRMGNFAYITDASLIPDTSYHYLDGLEVLIINALQHHKHYSHFNLDEAIFQARKIKARQTILTHISHHLGTYQDVKASLPEDIAPGYDGLTFQVHC